MKYLDTLQGQLVAASRELADSPERPARRRRVRFPALVGRHAYLSAALAVVTLAAASGAIADASGLLGPNLSTPSPLGAAASVPSGLASSFAILRRPRDPFLDALPAAGATGAISVAGGIGQHYGVDIHLSRFAGAAGGVSVWLIPGSTGTCIYVSNGGGVCGSNDSVNKQGLVQHLIPVAGGATTFIGVVPDGATVTTMNLDGAEQRVSLAGGAFSITGDPNLRSVTIHEPGGQTLTLDGRAAAAAPIPPAGTGTPSP